MSGRGESDAIALATALLPLVTVHLCYALAIGADRVPACIPYLEGCTSISATGRYGWSYFVFKGGMLPAAVLTAWFWWLCRRWLRLVGDDSAWPAAIAWTGIIAAVFLVLYTLFLGHKGEVYNFMRRFGVTVYLGFGSLAQLMTLARLHRLGGTRPGLIPRRLLRAGTVLAMLLLALGLGSIPVSDLVPDEDVADAILNAIEWDFCALAVGFYLVLWRAWRATGFAIRFEVDGAAARPAADTTRRPSGP